MKEATEEQKAASAERRKKMQGFCRQIRAMSDCDRAKLAASLPGVHTVEGRQLSVHNSILIMMQGKDATIVGGFRQWKATGRIVRKGEHSIMIWIPKFVKQEENNGDMADGALDGFLLGHVFDVSQTEECAS